MQAVRIELQQQHASYKHPTSDVIRESLPLPPYSTVIGMIHAACGFTHTQPMDISIQGTVGSHTSETYKRNEFNNTMSVKYETKDGVRTRRQNIVMNSKDGTEYGINDSVATMELLNDINLIIHVIPHDQTLVDTIAHGMMYPKNYPSLGRWEDLVRIDKVVICELEEMQIDEEECVLEIDAYIPNAAVKQWLSGTENEIPGTVHPLNKRYEINKKGIREWVERVDARHVRAGTVINAPATIYIDTSVDTSENMTEDGRPYIPVFPG